MVAEQYKYNKQQVLEYVDSDAVQAELVSLGVDVAVAKDRIAHMTNSEISALNAHMRDMPAAGDVLLTILVVVLVLELLGVTDVFSFISPI